MPPGSLQHLSWGALAVWMIGMIGMIGVVVVIICQERDRGILVIRSDNHEWTEVGRHWPDAEIDFRKNTSVSSLLEGGGVMRVWW